MAKGELRILGPEGDIKVRWDTENDDDVQAAEEQFDSLIAKNYSAFAVKKNGEKGKKITKFNPTAGAIIMVPPIAGG